MVKGIFEVGFPTVTPVCAVVNQSGILVVHLVPHDIPLPPSRICVRHWTRRRDIGVGIPRFLYFLKDILNRKMTGWVAALVVVGCFLAGLWPFSFHPPNRVTRLADRAGLQFRTDGVAYDPEPLTFAGSGRSPDEPATFALELWLEAEAEPGNDVFHILTIHDGQLPSNLVLCQWKSELLLRSPARENRRGFREVGVEAVLQKRQARFFTVNGDASGTAFYVDGKLTRHFPGFVLPSRRLNGQMVLGTSPAGKQSWNGKLLGMAVFDRSLNAAEVALHHEAWTNNRTKRLITEQGLTALYLFDEPNGPWAKDISRNRHRVFIPPFYHAIQRIILDTPSEYFRLGFNSVDLSINILGFAPVGFFLLAYLRMARPGRWLQNVILVMLVGTSVSLGIELIQVWMPTRHSSAMDLVCNATGTLLGELMILMVRLDSGGERR